MTTHLKLAAAMFVLTSSGLASLPARAATLLGDTVTCARNGVACNSKSSATVASGVEFDRSAATFDFSGTGLIFTLAASGFDGPLVYSFADASHPFTAMSNLTFTGNSGLNSSRVTFANGIVSFDLGGISGATTGSTVSLNLTTAVADVPEPATWAMMLIGFAIVGATARYRRRRTNIVYV